MTTPGVRGKGKQHVTTIRLDNAEKAKLKRLAKAERRSQSDQLRYLLAQAPDVRRAA